MKDDRLAADIEAYLEEHRLKFSIPGISFVLVRKGCGPLYLNMGTVKCSSNRKVDENTVYNTASVSKGFTTLAVMLLQERSLLNIDAPVKEVIPWFRTADSTISDKITVRHLMQHASGLASDAHRTLNRKFKARELETELRHMQFVETICEPGTQFVYSNINFHILQYLIEIVSGCPFHQFMEKHVFRKLTMTRTGYQATVRDLNNRSSGHKMKNNTLKPSNHRLPARLWGEGGVFTTTADAARYIEMLLNGGLVGDERFIQPSTLHEMHAGTIQSDRRHSSYGLGWFVTERTVEHFGSAPHFTAKIILCPTSDFGIALFSNTGDTINHELCDEIKNMILGEPHENKTPRYQRKIPFTLRVLKSLSARLQ